MKKRGIIISSNLLGPQVVNVVSIQWTSLLRSENIFELQRQEKVLKNITSNSSAESGAAEGVGEVEQHARVRGGVGELRRGERPRVPVAALPPSPTPSLQKGKSLENEFI